MGEGMVIPKDVKDIAKERIAALIKKGVSFDVSLRDMLVDAYVQGFIDRCQINVRQRKEGD